MHLLGWPVVLATVNYTTKLLPAGMEMGWEGDGKLPKGPEKVHLLSVENNLVLPAWWMGQKGGRTLPKLGKGLDKQGPVRTGP